MRRYKKIWVPLSLMVVFSMFVNSGKAQRQTILPEISYLYLQKLVASAKENYPRLKGLNSEIEQAKNDLSIAKISWLEPFNFQYVARSNEANTNLVTVTTADVLTGYQFGVTFNPSSLFTKPATVKKARQQIAIAQYNKEEYDLTLEAMVKSRYFTYIQAEKSLIPLNNAFLDAESNFKLSKIAFQKAEIKIDAYNAASMMYNQAYTSKLQAETAFLISKAALEELTVKKLEEIK